MEPDYSATLLRNTIDSSMDMIQVFEAVRNGKNEIVDFKWILNNKASEAVFGDVIGKSLLTLNPGVIEEGIFASFKKVVETGESDVSIRHYVHEQFNAWFHQSAVKQGDGVATTTRDVTDLKKIESDLKQGRDFLQSVLGNTSSSIMLLQPVRTADDVIVDFEYRYTNGQSLQSVGRNKLIGKRFTEEFPGVKSSGLLQRYVDVTNGKGEWSGETHVNYDGFDVWAQVYATTLNGGLLVTYFDITERKKAQEENLQLKDEMAQRAEDNYRRLFNSIDEGFCIYELLYNTKGEPVDLRWIEVNPAHENHTGLKDVVGKTHRELSMATEKYWLDIYHKVLTTGQAVHFENWHEPTQSWYRVSATPMRIAGSKQVAVVFENVTERKQLEQLQEYLLRLNDVIRPLADPLEIQAAAADLLGEHLNVNQSYYGERIGDFIYIDHAYANGLPPMTGKFRCEEFGKNLAEGCLSGQVQVCHDASTDPALSKGERQTLASINMGAYVALPIVKDGEWVATLAVHCIKPRQWKQYEIELIRETAERTWTAAEKAKAEDALRHSEAKYRTLFNSMDEGVSTIQLIFSQEKKVVDFIFLEHNPAAMKYNRVGPEIIGKRQSEVFPDLEPYWHETYERVSRTGESERQEHYFVTFDSWYDIYISTVGGKGSHQVVCVYNNIAERKRNEFRQALLNEISKDLVVLDNIDNTIKLIGEKIAKHFKVSWCIFAETTDDLDTLMVSSVWNADEVTAIKGTYTAKDFWSEEQILRNNAGELTIVNDTQNDPRISAEKYASLNISSFIAVPLARNGSFTFMIAICDTKTRKWRDDEIELAKELTTRIWVRLERARAEEALRESQAHLSATFEALPVGISVVDATGKTLLHNQAMKRFLPEGVIPSRSEEVSKRWVAYNPDGSQIARENYPGARALRGETVMPGVEFLFRQDDGAEIWTLFTAVPVRDKSGNVVEAMVLIADIDKLKRVSVALSESEHQLKKLLKLRDEFIGVASHELKTPVTSIKAYAEVVQEIMEERRDTKESELLSLLNAQIDRLTALINNLLDTTKISEGQLRMSFEEVALDKLLQERIAEIKRTSDHFFVYEVGVMPPIIADRERIGQVITNLLSNAIKYSPAQSTITVRCSAAREQVRISVQDEGYGIPKEDLNKIFDKFFRVTTNNMDTFPGMGLGLFITAQIIKKHGGAITVDSKEGEGSVFTFTLPYDPVR